ncbi:MAG TPA: hypothetical protein DCY06_00350 [Bacteroidetes bacterium]|nr:hypothetical protein [Bacteroidota bacterium]HRI46029.1 cation:proton antiporter [Ignavibacteriaceae bacterium]
MHDYGIIREIVIILAVSLPILFLFKKANIPSIIGFLIAGVIIGPFGFKLIDDTSKIEVMAEIGVILLMFTIGLEFSIEKLIKMKELLFFTGGFQVIGTIAIAGIIFYSFGVPLNSALFFGMLISLSSTAIVLKLLVDKNDLSSPYGKISLSILIFQDLAIVPMLILLPILGADEGVSLAAISIQMLISFGLVAVIILLAKYLIPKLLFHIANLRIREVFTIGILLFVLGISYMTEVVGLSFSIGAFIAGIIISESEFSYEIVAEILPFKDAFNSLFFVSVGLLLNVEYILMNPVIVFPLIGGIILLKSGIIILIIKAMKYPARIGVIAGLSLSQIGEFSFILAQAGIGYDLISKEFFNAFLAASIFTMIFTPLLIQIAPLIASKFSFLDGKNLRNVEDENESEEATLKNHVVIVGFGLNGKNLASVLKETGIPYIVVELNPETVLRQKSLGEKIIYGDSTKKEILHKTHIHNAKVIVFAISDPGSTRSALKVVKQMNPNVYAVVRTRYISEIEDLMKLGADEVIPEEFETSLQIFAKVLTQYHIPLNVIMKQTALLRGESYRMMRRSDNASPQYYHLDEILAQGLTETFFVSENNRFIGKSLKEINLRAATEATIIAIVRGAKTISNPSGNEKIFYNDTLVITGTHLAVDKAFDYLEEVTKDT